MARIKVRYFVAKPAALGQAYYWQPKAEYRQHGFALEALGRDRGRAIARAEQLNAQLDAWREGRDATRPTLAAGSFKALIVHYKTQSDSWPRLGAKTQRDYERCFARIEDWSGDAPVAAIDRKLVRKFRDSMAATPAMANAVIRVLRLLLNHAVDEGLIVRNPAARPGLSQAAPNDILWPREAMVHIVATADAMGLASIGDAVLLNSWLGQREGDIVNLPLAAYRQGSIWIAQRKLARRRRDTGGSLGTVSLPVADIPEVKARLEAIIERKKSARVTDTALITCETTGRRYSESWFTRCFARVRAQAAAAKPTVALDPKDSAAGAIAIADLKFRLLRHTAVTYLAEAGVDLPGICAITGQSPRSVQMIVERYLVRTRKLARQAFAQRLAYEREGTKTD